MFYCIFERYICGVFWNMSLRMAAITNTLLHLKPILAWEMYDPGLSCNLTYLYFIDKFQNAIFLHCSRPHTWQFSSTHWSYFLEILVSSFQILPFTFIKNMDFSHKIYLHVSPGTNNGPELNLEIQGAAVCWLLTVCCIEEFTTWPLSVAA